MSRTRYMADRVAEDLGQRMVFVGGPRQVGKTTLALSLLNGGQVDESHPAYLNWDVLEDRGRVSFLVTGSAKLDYYRRGGDSLPPEMAAGALRPGRA
jgi:uncharacterized protein